MAEVKRMKIALFKSDYVTMIAEQRVEEYMHDYVRISEYLEVDFALRPIEELLPDQLAAIDAVIAEVNLEYGEKLETLRTKRANLLALTDQRSEPERDHVDTLFEEANSGFGSGAESIL